MERGLRRAAVTLKCRQAKETHTLLTPPARTFFDFSSRFFAVADMWAQAVLCAAVLCALCPAGRTEAERDERQVPDLQDSRYNSNRLLGALHDVLERLQTTRINPWEKKYGQVPSCDLGEHCAIRKGSRIGKMCDCPRGAFCNFFLLKCL
uniref:Cocaine- and amphetamine-regulated transcript protein n=3 Tax=Oryzias TaxID=8089 RepID=A0A3P9IX09_ORYLA